MTRQASAPLIRQAAPGYSDQGTGVLRIIGEGLSGDHYPIVWDGGFVSPGGLAVSPVPPGELEAYANEKRRERERGSAARPREGTAGRKRPTDGSRTTGEATSAIVGGIGQTILDQLVDVEFAYPRLRVWRRPGGIWILIHAGLIYGSAATARFLVAVPFTGKMPKAWGFWGDGSWIGPKHTNFGDGSICCLHLPDNTWGIEDQLVLLLDLYTLWAVRHLYLRDFGRWPGRQVATLQHERLTEILDDELCGCGSSVRYIDCCKSKDVQRYSLSAAIEFAVKGGERAVPRFIWNFLNGIEGPPSFDKIVFY